MVRSHSQLQKGVDIILWGWVDQLMSVLQKIEGSRPYFSPWYPDIFDEPGGAVSDMFLEYFSTDTYGQKPLHRIKIGLTIF